jgi:hypothetical protein
MTERKNNKSRPPGAWVSPRGSLPANDQPLTGQALVAAMQASPHRDIEIEPERIRMPVRDVAL